MDVLPQVHSRVERLHIYRVGHPALLCHKVLWSVGGSLQGLLLVRLLPHERIAAEVNRILGDLDLQLLLLTVQVWVVVTGGLLAEIHVWRRVSFSCCRVLID